MCVLGAVHQDSLWAKVKGYLLNIDQGEEVLEHESVV
jgi:hypothetical protein